MYAGLKQPRGDGERCVTPAQAAAKETRKHTANRYFRARNLLPRNNADVTHCEKTVFYFQTKAVYRAEDRPTDICLKNCFYLIEVKT